ncbi:glycosyltransferase family 2 protein [Paenibacillus radicis (ex Xue et al. 2023)]|uniref:Glycosyltransferase n=1 Tax=Paenibacillus radicis (ex Xue et al. 2023) TaxID=2972489 RepID=A0ABT1YUN1_9BACL|nr:glycosyltransferase family 2 protein [Paenibacillus radicis (ex Xue et al. 2023)]MCR8636075.1 glycosyltransferase [Paenibacillus radicis (ex Xue et al. 2023)]
MKSKVTVLIPFYNSGPYLVEAIKSVFQQTYEDWQLILIDDASTEEYLSSIQKYLKDDRVRLIRHLWNLGQSMSLNKGLAYTKTPYLLQLDSDDLLVPEALEVLLNEARDQPEQVGLICSNLLVFYEDEQGEITKTITKRGAAFDDRYSFLMANTSLCPRFYKVSALHDIGGWPVDDPYEGRYREDMLTLYRLIEDYHFHWVDKTLYKHRIHQNNHTRQVDTYTEVMEWSVRNALQRWGDLYEPAFEKTEGGWKRISFLELKKQENE